VSFLNQKFAKRLTQLSDELLVQDTSAGMPPAIRQFGLVNWIGLSTLYKREVRRFMKVAVQTVFAPTVTTLLYILIFTVALRGASPSIDGVPYAAFLAPGLVMMGLLNNAFANSSSSLIVAKVQGNAVDFLMPPISAAELTAAFVAGAATRGVAVAAASLLVIAPFTTLAAPHPWAIFYFGLMAAVMFGAAGILAGLWAEKFEHLAAVTGFIITPLTFLSGTFYSIDRLPNWLQTLTHLNPTFHVIDGFRYGFTGHADGDLLFGAAAAFVVSASLVVASFLALKAGYKLKS